MAHSLEHGFFTKVYYAHPMTLYGTKQEKRDIELIESFGFTVVNPNAPEYEEGYKKLGMCFFRELITDCDAVIYRSFPDGSIPSGVGYEICVAVDQKKPVLELPTGFKKRCLSVEETRETLMESGQR